MEKGNGANFQLQAYRKQQGWTQAEVAEKIGASAVEVGRWERGEVAPRSYCVRKLCQLYGATAEELGLTSVPRKLESSTEHVAPEAEISSLPEVSSLPGEPVTLSKKGRGIRNSKRFVGGVAFLLLLVIGSLLLMILAPWKWFVHTNQALIPPETSAFYQANWSKGPDHWPFTSDWQWSSASGGMMESAIDTANQVVLAPVSPPSTDYAIEAMIERIGYANTTTGGKAYGIVVRDANLAGYICGAGAHASSKEHFFLSTMKKAASYYILSDLADVPAQLDNGWHLYRIEVRTTTMAFYLDTHFIQQVDSIAGQGGRIGIYVDNASIALKSFRVLTL